MVFEAHRLYKTPHIKTLGAEVISARDVWYNALSSRFIGLHSHANIPVIRLFQVSAISSPARL